MVLIITKAKKYSKIGGVTMMTRKLFFLVFSVILMVAKGWAAGNPIHFSALSRGGIDYIQQQTFAPVEIKLATLPTNTQITFNFFATMDYDDGKMLVFDSSYVQDMGGVIQSFNPTQQSDKQSAANLVVWSDHVLSGFQIRLSALNNGVRSEEIVLTLGFVAPPPTPTPTLAAGQAPPPTVPPTPTPTPTTAWWEPTATPTVTPTRAATQILPTPKTPTWIALETKVANVVGDSYHDNNGNVGFSVVEPAGEAIFLQLPRTGYGKGLHLKMRASIKVAEPVNGSSPNLRLNVVAYRNGGSQKEFLLPISAAVAATVGMVEREVYLEGSATSNDVVQIQVEPANGSILLDITQFQTWFELE
jgi:hypothetical protein